MTESKYPVSSYPPNCPPGTYWSTDVAWEILDTLPVGTLSDEQRAYLGGLIAGALSRERSSRMWPARFPPRQSKPGPAATGTAEP